MTKKAHDLRELDARIDVEVMGRTTCPYLGGEVDPETPHYSTDWKATGNVLDCLRDRHGLTVRMTTLTSLLLENEERGMEAQIPSVAMIPEGICRTALQWFQPKGDTE